jgi:hypothetical protein
MSGSAFRRYADDFIVDFQHDTDARRLVHPRGLRGASAAA